MKKFLFISVLLMFFLINGCERMDGSGENYPTPVFVLGDLVKSRIDGTKGQVVSVHCMYGSRICTYDVKFSMKEIRTDTRILSSDGPIRSEPFVTYRFLRDYEIEKIQ